VEKEAALKAGFPILRMFAVAGALLALALPSTGKGQGAPRDTVARADSTSAIPDTLNQKRSPSGVDTTVVYTASDSIVYSLSRKTMFMYGKGDITYRELGLKAENIDINWTTAMLNAHGTTGKTDTTKEGKPDRPQLVDGSEVYKGDTIVYNFRTKKGRVNLGSTEIEKGFYYGDEIKKIDSDVLCVADGVFTTCDLPHPHYYFGSPEMKVLVKNKIIGRPIYLYLADVPVFALPFGIFPSERGRRSGLIAPAFGESGTRGRYLSHLGYYWAMSDYMDLALKADGYTGGSYVLSGDYRYALRYKFSGSLSGSYGKTVYGEAGDPSYSVSKDFNMRWSHNQQFTPTMHMVVDFTFMSGSYFQNTSLNLNDLLQQNIVSNATLTKSWEGTPYSMSVNIHRDQYLQTGQTRTVLPSISFNQSIQYPFRSKRRGGSSGSLKWYEMIGYTYSGQFLDVQTKDPIYDAGTRNVVDYSHAEHRGVLHQMSFNASQKAGYFTFTPFVNYTEKWYDRRTEQRYDAAAKAADLETVKAITAVRYYNLGISAQTKFFGIIQPGVFGIKAIRHQVTPSVSYSYQPDFGEDRYGYYGSYVDTSNVVHRYGRYDREVFGGAPFGRSQAISFNIGNVFEMKTATADTSQQDNKFQLLNLNAGISYNFVADSLKFSEIGLDYRTSIGQYLSIGGNSRFNLYSWEPYSTVSPASGGRRVNKFVFNERGRLADLTYFSLSVSTQLKGEKKETKAGPERNPADSLGRKRTGYVGLYNQEAPDFSIPWNMDLSYSITRSQADPNNPYISSGLSARLAFNLTEFWKITATTSYDLLNRVFTAPQITVYRDLHCWELNFEWMPTGPYRHFKVEIRLKASELQDIKVTKQGSASGIY
jgi:lipopolysaccharide assembly outer membrane protein LptD (OstA)